MVARFKIFSPKTLKFVQEYSLEYTDREELITLFEEARQTWDEYMVMMEYDDRAKVSQKTYIDEIRESL